MKNKLLYAPLTALIGMTACANAASISWQPSVNMYAEGNVDTWISTNGTSLIAINGGGDAVTTQTVNGVTFTAATFTTTGAGITGGGVTMTGNFSAGAGPTTFGDGEFSGNAPLYNLINSAVYGGGGDSTTVSFSGLTVGNTYEMQIMANDARGGTNAGIRDVAWQMGLTDGADATTIAATVDLTNRPFNDSSSPDVAGDYIIGTFTADAGTQTFNMVATRSGFTIGDALTNPNGNQVQFNGFQLRDISPVPEPSSALLALVGLAFGLRRQR